MYKYIIMDADLSLFPDINPNIDEIVKQQNAIAPEEVATEPLPEKKNTHREIFIPLKMKNKKVNRDNVETNSPTLTIIEEDIETSPPVDATETHSPTQQVKKGKYAHLAKARQKGLEKRRAKAAEKALLKAKAKEVKELEKQKRRDATKERNRLKARERYRRLKAEKDKKKVETKQETTEIFNQVAPKNMSFKQFTKYMNQYETTKLAYEKKRQMAINKRKQSRTQSKPVQRTIPKPKPPQFHPTNYPLAHLYNPQNWDNKDYF